MFITDIITIVLYINISMTILKDNLTISVWNLNGFYHSEVYFREVMKKSDIVCFSEHQLYDCKFNKMTNRCIDFECIIRPSKDLTIETFSNLTGHCGVGTMWKKAIGNVVTPLSTYIHDRICGIKITIPGSVCQLYIFSV